MLEHQFKVKGKWVVSYLGAAGIANGLDYFIECANLSRKNNLPIHFILAGEGARLSHVKAAAEKLQLSNITFTGLVNRDTVKKIMNITDVAMVCYKNVPILETGSPNKYFDALASGKLIVANFGGWIKEEIETHQCGFYADPKHPIDFVNKIMPFINNAQRLKAYQTNARKLAETNYARKNLLRLFLEVLKVPMV